MGGQYVDLEKDLLHVMHVEHFTSDNGNVLHLNICVKRYIKIKKK